MYFRCLISIVVLISLSSCDSDSENNTALPAGNEIEFQTLAMGFHSGSNETDRSFQVLRSQSEYEQKISLSPDESPSPVDFENGIVLFASYGFAPQNAHSIEIVSIVDRGNFLEANITLKLPFNCAAGNAITNPYHFVYVEQQGLVLAAESLEDSC